MNHVVELNQQIEQFGLTAGEAQALRLLLCGQRNSAEMVERGVNVTTILALKASGHIARQGEVWDITDEGVEALSVYEVRREEKSR